MKLIEELAASLGKEGFKQYQKQIIPGIIANFADKNTQVKEESIKCIVKLISIMGLDSMASYFPSYLNIDNYEMKHEILNILIKNKNFVSNKKDYIKEYSAPLINCLLDKNGIIRTMAEEISQEIVKYHGIQIFNDEIKNLKTPTVINQVKLILNRISKIVNLNNPTEISRYAVKLVHDGEEVMYVKGSLETRDVLKAVLDKEIGLKIDDLISLVGVFEIEGKMMYLTDPSVIPYPTLENKVQLINNAVKFAASTGLYKRRNKRLHS
jgi:hypothetical protein